MSSAGIFILLFNFQIITVVCLTFQLELCCIILLCNFFSLGIFLVASVERGERVGDQ